VFRSKRADRLKVLVWDRTGLVLIHKRLEGGKFVWPQVRDGVIRLSAAQFAALFEGLDWRLVRPERRRSNFVFASDLSENRFTAPPPRGHAFWSDACLMIFPANRWTRNRWERVAARSSAAGWIGPMQEV
jgi:hypothetical protein